MKKLVFAILLTMVCTCAHAQDYGVSFTLKDIANDKVLYCKQDHMFVMDSRELGKMDVTYLEADDNSTVHDCLTLFKWIEE